MTGRNEVIGVFDREAVENGRWTLARAGCSILVACEVRTSPAAAMQSLRDTRTWPAWSPSITAVESDDRHIHEGTRGHLRIAGVRVPFRVTACSSRRWEWRVAGIPATGHRVEAYAGDSERCRVGIEVPLAAIGYVPACKRALDRFAALIEGD